jgi:hypothetical protein
MTAIFKKCGDFLSEEVSRIDLQGAKPSTHATRMWREESNGPASRAYDAVPPCS